MPWISGTADAERVRAKLMRALIAGVSRWI
jgi:hypothetical protein